MYGFFLYRTVYCFYYNGWPVRLQCTQDTCIVVNGEAWSALAGTNRRWETFLLQTR